MELINENIRLRPLRYNDKESIAKLANNKKIWNSLRDIFPYPYTIEDAVKYIDMAIGREPTVNFAIEYEHEFSGVISLILQSDVYSQTAEVGYWIGEPFWRKGIATHALKLITDYGLNTLDLRRIYASVFEGNTGSQRVLEKCGYECEGIFRKAAIKNNKVLDELHFATLKRH